MKFVQLKKEWKGKPIGERISVDDDNATLMIQAGVAEAIVGDPMAELIQRSIEGVFANFDKGLTAGMETLVKQFANASAKSRRNAIPEIFGPGNSGDPDKTFGAFLLAIRTGDTKALDAMGSQFVEWSNPEGRKTAMSTNVGTVGGFLVPMQHYNMIMAVATENSVVRPRAMVIPMSARELEIPSLDTAAPSAGTSAFLGGITATWTEEGANLTETNPNFKDLKLTNYELSGFTKINNSLNEDAPALETYLYKLFGQAVAWYEDYAFMRGNGVGKPLGAQTWQGFIGVDRSAASAFSLVDYANMVSRWVGTWDINTCCWVAHCTVLAKLLTMGDAAGNLIFNGPTVNNKPSLMLGGLPVAISEKVPSLNTLGDITLNDWSKYVIGDRKQIEIAFSAHAGFTTNQVFWRFVSRVAGAPWLRDKFTLADASTTISPFIGLNAG